MKQSDRKRAVFQHISRCLPNMEPFKLWAVRPLCVLYFALASGRRAPPTHVPCCIRIIEGRLLSSWPSDITLRYVDGVAWTAAMHQAEPSRTSQSRLAARRETAVPRPTAKCKVSSVTCLARFGPAWLGYVYPSPHPSYQLTADRAKRCRLWRQTAGGATTHVKSQFFK